MRVEVLRGDATAIEGDVLALKYAQARYGLDAYVVQRLLEAGHTNKVMSPKPGGFRILPSPEGVAARQILFVGVEPLRDFEYKEIRAFARKVLVSLAGEVPDTKRLLVTVHGPGYGLDEDEAFESQLAGFLDAIDSSDAPEQLELISFVELNSGRADRLQRTLQQIIPDGLIGRRDRSWREAAGPETSERIRAVGYASASKSHVFVAMSFSDDMEDIYHYGIRNAVKASGLLCERADLSAFTGDVMTWVRERIKTASLVIAELSGANPNVYLEVGFAWGCGIPTVLLAKDASELRFDTKGQRCLTYTKIKDLEEKLASELKSLNMKGGVEERHAVDGAPRRS